MLDKQYYQVPNKFREKAPEIYNAFNSGILQTNVIDLISKAYLSLADYPIEYEITFSKSTTLSLGLGGELKGVGLEFNVEFQQNFEYEFQKGYIILGIPNIPAITIKYNTAPSELTILSWISKNYDISQLVFDVLNEIANSSFGFIHGSPSNATIIDQNGRVTGYNGTTFINYINGSYIFTPDDEKEIYTLPKSNNYSVTINGYDNGLYNATIVAPLSSEIRVFRFENTTTTNVTRDRITFTNDLTESGIITYENEKVTNIQIIYYKENLTRVFKIDGLKLKKNWLYTFEVLDWNKLDETKYVSLKL